MGIECSKPIFSPKCDKLSHIINNLKILDKIYGGYTDENGQTIYQRV